MMKLEREAMKHKKEKEALFALSADWSKQKRTPRTVAAKTRTVVAEPELQGVVAEPRTVAAESELQGVVAEPVMEGVVASEPVVAEPVVASECVVCLDKKRSHAIVPCGHLSLCEFCAKTGRFRSCPVCRGVIESIIKIHCV